MRATLRGGLSEEWHFENTLPVAALLAGLLLSLVLAVCPEMHELVHHGGDAAEHQCLATLLQTGGCDDTAPQSLLVAAFFGSLSGQQPVNELVWVESVFASGCVFEHAPPAVS
jgi:hypothetical protein